MSENNLTYNVNLNTFVGYELVCIFHRIAVVEMLKFLYFSSAEITTKLNKVIEEE